MRTRFNSPPLEFVNFQYVHTFQILIVISYFVYFNILYDTTSMLGQLTIAVHRVRFRLWNSCRLSDQIVFHPTPASRFVVVYCTIDNFSLCFIFGRHNFVFYSVSYTVHTPPTVRQFWSNNRKYEGQLW